MLNRREPNPAAQCLQHSRSRFESSSGLFPVGLERHRYTCRFDGGAEYPMGNNAPSPETSLRGATVLLAASSSASSFLPILLAIHWFALGSASAGELAFASSLEPSAAARTSFAILEARRIICFCALSGSPVLMFVGAAIGWKQMSRPAEPDRSVTLRSFSAMGIL